MNARTELREAYEQLAGSAPDRSVLTLPSAARNGRGRRRRPVRGALVACAVVLIAVVPFVLVHRHDGDAGPQVGSSSPVPPAGTDESFWFTSTSMPGFQMSQQIFTFVDGQSAVYDGEAGMRGRMVTVAGIVSSAATDARLISADVVRVGAHEAFYHPAHAGVGVPTQARVAWKFASGKWLVLSATRSSGGASNGLLPDLPRAELLRLATAFRPRPDVNVALAKIGYLPAHFRFAGEYAYLHQGTMLSPDGMVGTGYRSMSFSTGGPESTTAPSIDITAVYDPNASLSSAASLPTFDQGPWTRTTLRGHLAWTDPHTVLIQWGPVQIGVSSSRITGSSTPRVGLSELLKVARSLTVPVTTLPGHGYPLAAAVPAGHLK